MVRVERGRPLLVFDSRSLIDNWRYLIIKQMCDNKRQLIMGNRHIRSPVVAGLRRHSDVPE